MGIRLCADCKNPLSETARYNTRFCPSCVRQHHLDAMARYREKNGARLRAEDNEEYYYYKEHGICVDCHHNAATEGYTTCPTCREKRNKKYKKKA